MRDEHQLLQLRPDLQLPTNQSKPEESFQNQTLRPILKMQHPLLVHLFNTHIQKRKNVFFKLAKPAQMDWITDAVRADLRFRNLLIGTVIGHFTIDELRAFEASETELMRRLTKLIIQRLQSEDFEGLENQ